MTARARVSLTVIAVECALSPRAALPAAVRIVDSAGNVGNYPSIAFGTDGRAIISYHDTTNEALKVAHCEDEACTTATVTTLDTDNIAGVHSSIMIGSDGLPLIAYRAAFGASLRVAHCENIACTSASLATLDPGSGGVFGRTAAAIGVDGLPLIAYGTYQLKTAHCFEPACPSAILTTYPGQGGINIAMVVGGDGRGLLAGDALSDHIYIGHCHDVGCTTATFVDVPDAPEGQEVLTYRPALARGADGLGVIAYTRFVLPQFTDFYTQLRRCTDPACQNLTPPVTIGGGDGQWDRVSLGMLPGNRPLTVQQVVRPGDPSILLARACDVPSCATTTSETVDHVDTIVPPSVAVRADGTAMVAYYDSVQGDLKVARLDGGDPDLALALTATPDPVVPGDALTYTLTVTNHGPGTVVSAVVTDALPSSVAFEYSPGCTHDRASHVAACSFANVPAGGTATADIHVRVLPVAPGPIVNTAVVAAAGLPDPNPGNNTATATVTLGRWLSVDSPSVVEGNGGITALAFQVSLVDSTPAGPTATVDCSTADGTAGAGTDYVATSGTLTFTPSALTQTVTVGVVGDLLPEDTETFFLRLANAQGAGIGVPSGTGLIVDDDPAAPATTELSHGSLVAADLAGGPDVYAIAQASRSSYEVLVDDVAGDVVPVALERLAPDGSTVLQSGAPVGTGTSVSLRWERTSSLPALQERVRVGSNACGTGCGSDDRYRLRAYETTGRIARFNNSGSQVTVLLLENPSDRPVTGTAWFWSTAGTLLHGAAVSLPARGVLVANTLTLPSLAGVSGSITVTHDAPYGVLQGKAVAVEPPTGFSFDTPLVYRPR